MRISQDVRDYAAEHGLDDQSALTVGMDEKAASSGSRAAGSTRRPDEGDRTPRHAGRSTAGHASLRLQPARTCPGGPPVGRDSPGSGSVPARLAEDQVAVDLDLVVALPAGHQG